MSKAGKNTPRNRWDDPKSIRKQNFASGAVTLGMSPAENLYETIFCQDLTEAYNRKKKRKYKAVHHARIDSKGLKIPDISFFNRDLKAEVIVEVDERKSRAAAVRKSKNALEKHGVLEAFVYLFDTAEWLKIAPAPNGKLTALPDDYSEVLTIHLSELCK
ncbi:hypothetical protein [Rhodoflexus caldus]|uniref:hypothetical protein n=1 Tax=Rhodoflexus caldus TaxID=2891236 RepID=UPI00202A9CEB|nr:hypothetical protein [Rhodoflexus caldus]